MVENRWFQLERWTNQTAPRWICQVYGAVRSGALLADQTRRRTRWRGDGNSSDVADKDGGWAGACAVTPPSDPLILFQVTDGSSLSQHALGKGGGGAGQVRCLMWVYLCGAVCFSRRK